MKAVFYVFALAKLTEKWQKTDYFVLQFPKVIAVK